MGVRIGDVGCFYDDDWSGDGGAGCRSFGGDVDSGAKSRGSAADGGVEARIGLGIWGQGVVDSLVWA